MATKDSKPTALMPPSTPTGPSTAFLNVDLSKIEVGIEVPLEKVHPWPEGEELKERNATVFTCMPLFFWELTHYEHVDVITYTYSLYHPIFRLRRLIYCLGDTPPARFTPKRITNVHTKLYLGYSTDRYGDLKVQAAFIGSQNCVAPTTHNLMVCTRNVKDLRKLADYFESLYDYSQS